jgi:hypothetical protein
MICVLCKEVAVWKSRTWWLCEKHTKEQLRKMEFVKKSIIKKFIKRIDDETHFE